MSKLVVVTGASGGMGQQTCKVFKKNGFTVIGTDRNKGIDLEVDHFFQGDITNETMWQEITKEISSLNGHLDALVNIAGRNYLANIDEADLDQWRNMMEVNVLGMVVAIKHTASLLKKAPNAAVVNMSSISGYIGSIGYAAYCTTKGAIDSLTKSLALELAPQVRVNAIAPGWIETPFTVEGLEKSADPIAYRKEVEAMHALNRVGTPNEIAESIFWLATGATFMTGSVVIVDGGYMIKN
jgi:meso-butanediol dehydrogenase/(S,S)-butanediol dehydrogenase/diacetyl reductase